jgi:error-prone DNA polymerase
MGTDAPLLPGMDEIEVTGADVWATGVSADSYPIQFLRQHLTKLGALPIASLSDVECRRTREDPGRRTDRSG